MKPPLIFRLTLCTIFMPIMILFGVYWYMILIYAPERAWEDYSTTFGVRSIYWLLAMMTLPFLLWFWMFWSGNWRRPVLTALVVYGGGFLVAGFGFAFDFIQTHTPPEKRMIRLDGVPGTDVYCNGVHLGQLPLRIRVDELIAKVPEWTTPPEQRWYDDRDHSSILYTWEPWDDFLEERFEANRNLFGDADVRRNPDGSPQQMTPRMVSERRDALNRHHADARYWWSFRFADSQKVRRQNVGNVHRLRTFDNQPSYQFGGTNGDDFPSLDFHIQLLVDVLPELTPEQKADWDRHVVKYWSLFQLGGQPLQRSLNQAAARHRSRDRNDPLVELYETALHSTARLMYGIADPPTEEDARRLLAEWIENSTTADWQNIKFRFGWDWSGSINLRPVQVSDGVLLPANIHEVMRRPLAEQWRKNRFRYDDGWAPVAYYSGLDRSADYFADFVRNFATMQNAMVELLENESPQVAVLFNTLINRRSTSELFWRQIDLYPMKIGTFSLVNNPAVEPAMRTYIEKALLDTNHNNSSLNRVNRAVSNAVFQRIDRDGIDKDDFAAWVAMLPLPPAQKNHVLRQLRLRGEAELTFADRLQQTAGRLVLIETNLTIDDMTKWLAENPDGKFIDFLGKQEDNIIVTNMFDRNAWEEESMRGFRASTSSFERMAEAEMMRGNFWTGWSFDTMLVGPEDNQWSMWRGLPECIVLTLLRLDTSEGDPQIRDLIRWIWRHDPGAIGSALSREYTTANVDRADRRQAFLFTGANVLPDYILDLYLDNASAEGDVNRHWARAHHIAGVLALSDSPKAGEILERLIAGESRAEMRRQTERFLEIWRVRDSMRQMKMEFFLDMVAGRVSPDDLLLPQPSWVWRDGRYVQAE